MHDKKSLDYQLNLETLNEMEEYIPMTKRERHCLRKWVKKGRDPETNPWNYTDCDGFQLNYLQSFRLEYGYASGSWDHWKGPEEQLYWNEDLKRFVSKNEL